MEKLCIIQELSLIVLIQLNLNLLQKITRRMTKILIFVFLLFLISNQKGMTNQQLTSKMIQFNASPLVSLMLVYDSIAPNTVQLLKLMDEIVQKRKGYFKVVLIDCNTDDEQVLKNFVYCQDQYRKQLPALMFSEPSLNQEMKGQGGMLQGVKPYQGPLDDKSLFNFAVPLMKIYSVQIKNLRDLKKFQQSNPNVPKIIYFTDKQKKEKIPPLFRALTAHFRHTIAFAHAFSKNNIVKDLNVTKFPTFLLNGKQQIKADHHLSQFIQRLNMIKGQSTKIFIKQLDSSNDFELTTQNIDQLVYKTPQHILIHVVGEDGKDHPAWINATQKFNRMFKLYETSTLKQALGVKQTPSIVYFPKSLAKKSVQKTVFSTKDTFEDIYNEIDSLIQDFTVPISNFIELQKLTSIHLQDQKFVAIYFHSKQIPIAYKVVSNDNKYQEDVAFFRMKDPEKDVVEQYQIKKLPALIVMIDDKQAQKPTQTDKQKKQGRVSMNLKIASYQGKYTYGDLSSFFSSFTKKRVTQQQKQSHESYGQSSNKLIEITKLHKLKSRCQENCFMLIINGSPGNEQKNKNYINIVQKQSDKMLGTNFVSVDGTCHSQLIGSFQIQEDQLPAFVYVDAKFEKFSRMVGRVEKNSLLAFFSKVKSRKAMYRGYSKLNFENKDCQFQHDKIKKLSQQTPKISEDQAAILEQLRAEEAKKREQFSQAQKEDKTRKKGKKKKPKKQQDEQQL